jgi:hypothetical protein
MPEQHPSSQQDQQAEVARTSSAKIIEDHRKKRSGYDTLSDENPLICRGID